MLHRIALPMVSEWCQDSVEYSARFPFQTDLRLLFYNPIHRNSWKVCSPKLAEARSNTYGHPLLKSTGLTSYFKAATLRIDEDSCISMNAENSQPIFDDQELDAK